MNVVKNLGRATTQLRQLSTSPAVKSGATSYGPLCPKYQAKQKLYQADNGLPVHLKKGFSDMVFFRTTAAVCFGGVIWSMAYLIKTSYKEFQ